MAGVSVRGRTVWITIGSGKNRRRFSLPGESTSQENRKRLARERERLVDRWKFGENLDALIEEWTGEKKSPNTLKYYRDHFFAVVAPQSLRDSTIGGYKSVYNANWAVFDDRLIETLTRTEIERHLATRKDLSIKGKRNALSVLRRIVALAIDDDAITRSFVPVIAKGRDEDNPEPDPYTKEERDALLSWLHENSIIAWRYFLEGFYTGKRTGELLGGAWAKYQKPYLTVDQEMVRREIRLYTKNASGKKSRTIVVSKIVQEMLDSNPTKFKRDLIHLSPQGHRFKDADWLMKWWWRAHDATGIRPRIDCNGSQKLYPWRSTFISMCVSDEVPLDEIAEMCGTSVDMIKKHYFKREQDKDRDEKRVSRLDGALK